MLHIYLDQNKWIDLSRADHGTPGGERFVDVLNTARAAVAANRVRFPLSLAHYMETWNQREADRRRRLSETMLSLAFVPEFIGPITIAGPEEIISMEIEACIARRLGKEPPPQRIFGDGIGHVFGDPTWGRTHVEIPDDYPKPLLPIVKAMKMASDRKLEAMLLPGPPIDFPVPGIDNHSYYNLSLTYLNRQRAIRERFLSLNTPKETRRLALVRLALEDILEIVTKTLLRLDVPREVLRIREDGGALEFVMDLPSQRLLVELMARSFDDPQFKRGRGDMNDVNMLSIATVYCDVVVAEKAWGSIVKQTKLHQEHETTVLYNLGDLLPILNRLAQT